jgi:hypothetical protein
MCHPQYETELQKARPPWFGEIAVEHSSLRRSFSVIRMTPPADSWQRKEPTAQVVSGAVRAAAAVQVTKR